MPDNLAERLTRSKEKILTLNLQQRAQDLTENKRPLKKEQIASSNFMQFPPPIKANFESL